MNKMIKCVAISTVAAGVLSVSPAFADGFNLLDLVAPGARQGLELLQQGSQAVNGIVNGGGPVVVSGPFPQGGWQNWGHFCATPTGVHPLNGVMPFGAFCNGVNQYGQWEYGVVR